MPPYGEKLTHTDRWAVTSYLRQLQRQAGTPAVPAAVVNPPDVAPGGQPLADTSGQQQAQPGQP
jgi:hypothetical protein